MKLIYINMIDEDLVFKTFSLQSYFPNESNLLILEVDGVIPGVIIKGNKAHVLLFENDKEPKVLEYDFSKNANNLLTLEYNENKILLCMNSSLETVSNNINATCFYDLLKQIKFKRRCKKCFMIE